MELGKKIRQLRFKAGLTQEQLSDKLGISPQSVSKWETGAAMPDISSLPLLAEVFGVSIDDLFDLTTGQRLNRIENRMDLEEELPPEVFREYEEYLREQLGDPERRPRALSLTARLYHHRMEACARKVSLYAREAILRRPEKKDCQWLLQKAEGSAAWDWNISNHSKVIDFYKEVIDADREDVKTPLPYYYLLDNLIADHRTREAAAYLRRFAELPAHRPFMVPVYEAAIALAEYDEKRADAVMEKALAEHAGETDLLFEAAQYYARKCDYEKAVRYYEASYAAESDRKPRYTDALDGIAVIYELLGDFRKAADTRKRILDALKNEWGFTEETVVAETEAEIERLLRKA